MKMQRNNITQIAQIELIELPAYNMETIHKEMLSSKQDREFCGKVTVADLRDIYSAQRPRPEKVSCLFTSLQNVLKEEDTPFAFSSLMPENALKCNVRICLSSAQKASTYNNGAGNLYCFWSNDLMGLILFLGIDINIMIYGFTSLLSGHFL